MDIAEAVRTEHSKVMACRIADYIADDASRFAVLMDVFFGDDYRQTQRASWPFGMVVEQFPELLLPYYTRVIAMLSQQDVHVAVKRNLLRVLQFQLIPEDYEGEVLDKAFTLFESKNEAIAVRVFAMQVVYNLSRKFPEIQPEIKWIIEESMPFASAAFKSRGGKILKELSKNRQ